MKYTLFFCTLFLLYSCNQVHNERQKTYKDFYNEIVGNEYFLIDSVFSEVKCIRKRGEKCYIIRFQQPDSLKLHIGAIPVCVRDEELFICGKNKDSFFLQNKKIDKKLFSHINDIINLCEKYGIFSIDIIHDPIYLSIDFICDVDTSISMTFSKENYDNFDFPDSSNVKNGWTIEKSVCNIND